MKAGYIIASNQVMKEGCSAEYIYREKPDNENDSGWRVFSGKEDQAYADTPDNFLMYNAATVVDANPEIADILANDYPVAFEWSHTAKCFIEIID